MIYYTLKTEILGRIFLFVFTRADLDHLNDEIIAITS